MIEQLYSILNEFKSPDFEIEDKIYGKICDFNKKKFNGKKLPRDSKFLYEEIAFAFMEGSPLPLEWGDSFYKPLFGYIDSINKQYISYPDIKNITPEMVNYWEQRSSEADNPILQCRYAGLVWDFSQKIRNLEPNIPVAYRFIDSIIQLATLGGDPFLKDKLERSLKLAVSINDQQRIISVRDSIIKYEDTHSEDDKIGTWGYSYDILIGDRGLYRKTQLETQQEDKIIKELERKLKKFSDKNSNAYKPHSVEYVVTKLAPYYKNKNDMRSMKRVLLIYRDSFLHGIKNNLVMVGSHWLEKIRKILFQYGLSEETKELESDIRYLQKEDLNYLQRHEISIKIPREQIDSYLSELDRRNLSKALHYIAFTFIPDKKEAEKFVLKSAKKYPSQAIFSRSIMDHTGRKVTEINPMEDDLEGHIVHHISQSMDFYLQLIGLGLNHLEKNKSLNAHTLSDHLFKSPVFIKANHPIIKEGLIAYFNKNYIVSCSVLIHQIESAIRELVSVGGGVIYQPSNNSKEQGFELRPLGALLRDEAFIKTFEGLNHNIPYFFRIILTDKRALNLRNSICHGHFTANFLNQGTAIHIIHILLILSILKKSEESSKK